MSSQSERQKVPVNTTYDKYLSDQDEFRKELSYIDEDEFPLVTDAEAYLSADLFDKFYEIQQARAEYEAIAETSRSRLEKDEKYEKIRSLEREEKKIEVKVNNAFYGRQPKINRNVASSTHIAMCYLNLYPAGRILASSNDNVTGRHIPSFLSWCEENIEIDFDGHEISGFLWRESITFTNMDTGNKLPVKIGSLTKTLQRARKRIIK